MGLARESGPIAISYHNVITGSCRLALEETEPVLSNQRNDRDLHSFGDWLRVYFQDAVE